MGCHPDEWCDGKDYLTLTPLCLLVGKFRFAIPFDYSPGSSGHSPTIHEYAPAGVVEEGEDPNRYLPL